MSDVSEMKARHERMLAELAKLGLALAADLQRRALAAGDDAVAAQLADSFHKVGRSVRQTMALEAKLSREHAVAAREIAAGDERARPDRIARRRAEVGAAVERLVWTEVEKTEFPFEDEDDADMAVGITAGALMEELTDEDFAETPAAVLVARLKTNIAAVLADVLRPVEGLPEEPELRNSA